MRAYWLWKEQGAAQAGATTPEHKIKKESRGIRRRGATKSHNAKIKKKKVKKGREPLLNHWKQTKKMENAEKLKGKKRQRPPGSRGEIKKLQQTPKGHNCPKSTKKKGAGDAHQRAGGEIRWRSWARTLD